MALIARFAPIARSTNRSTHSTVIAGCQLQSATADGASIWQAGDVVDLDYSPFFIDRLENAIPPCAAGAADPATRKGTTPAAAPGLLLEDRADQGTLACLEHVRIPERDPEALQACRRLLAVVEFLARPPSLSRLMDSKVEHVPVLDLVAIRGDVVDGLSELARDAELAKAGFLTRLAQGCVLGGFSVPDASCRYLDADMLHVVVGMAEDQELAVADAASPVVRE